jgi:hypothetical protein
MPKLEDIILPEEYEEKIEVREIDGNRVLYITEAQKSKAIDGDLVFCSHLINGKQIVLTL